MNHWTRNFLQMAVLYRFMTVWTKALSNVFQLRSLSGTGPDAIPGRNSSSSLPPFFVPGRFAVFCLPSRRWAVAQGV